MGLPQKSVHVRLDPEQHMQLSLLATLNGKEIAALAAELLTKGVVGEFHAVQRSAKLIGAIGISGSRKGS